MLLVSKIYRGSVVESFHIGYATAVNEKGEILFQAGDSDYPVYILDSAKPFQIIPLLEEGGVDKFHFSDEEVAVMCSTHNGENQHVGLVSDILKKLDLGIDDLHCGTQPPLDKVSYEQMILKGRRATPVYNSSSGTHVAMLALSKALDVSPVNYELENHPVQKRIFEKMKHYSATDKIPIAKDDSGLPTFFLPMVSLAQMYSTLAQGADDYLQKIFHIMSLHPKTIAGKSRFDTDFLSTMSGKGVAKMGSDGLRTIGIRAEEGKYVGIAIKVLSNHHQALDSMSIAVMQHLRLLDEETATKLDGYRQPKTYGTNDVEIGHVQTEIVVDEK